MKSGRATVSMPDSSISACEGQNSRIAWHLPIWREPTPPPRKVAPRHFAIGVLSPVSCASSGTPRAGASCPSKDRGLRWRSREDILVDKSHETEVKVILRKFTQY